MTKKSPSKPKTRASRSTQRGIPARQINLTLDQKLDIVGGLLVLAGILTLASQLSFSQGAITGPYLAFLAWLTGWGSYVLPLLMMAAGIWLVLRNFESVPRPTLGQVIGLWILYLAALVALQVIALGMYELNPTAIVETGNGGGQVGESLRQAMVNGLGQLGAIVVMLAACTTGLILFLNISPGRIIGILITAWTRLQASRARPEQEPGVWAEPNIQINGRGTAYSRDMQPESDSRASTPAIPAIGLKVISPAGSGDDTRPGQPATGPLYRPLPAGQVWNLPSVNDIFEPGSESALSEEDIHDKVNVIEETLQSLGVEARVIEVNQGPVVTQFGVEPGFVTTRNGKQTKVKVSKITALADDLALALAAKTIRIEAPVPGRSIVGIEVPNNEIATVTLLDVIESEEFQGSKSPLRIALGQNVSGEATMADLASMPHLLIAGTTGSGKSVCVNAIIACLLAFNTPDDLRFIMVDPKRVELTSYNGIPHLMSPVVVDLERVVGVLQWVTREMDSRYRHFAKLGVRNISDLNNKLATQPMEGQKKMHYIVVIIDELADLMMLAPEETEKTICRLAQMARATGIHLIIATQRPSVDVVTGLIKANFPARISFAVASSVDSRVILDQPGAERLLGRGDMLFVSPESGQPRRLQGCFVSDQELQKLTRYWKGIRGLEVASPPEIAPPTPPPSPVQQPLWDDLRADMEQSQSPGADDGDAMLQRAIEVVRLQKKASISLLQRRLRIGYTRAARLIDQMEQNGIVGPNEPGSRWREVLIDGGDLSGDKIT